MLRVNVSAPLPTHSPVLPGRYLTGGSSSLKSTDDQFFNSIRVFIIHVTTMSRLSIDQTNCMRFSQAVHECEDYLTILEPKVTSLNGAQQWVRQYKELFDLMGCLRRKLKSFGGFPMVSPSRSFDIRYSSDFPFFVVLKECQDQIKSNTFSVSEAQDLYMRYTDYRHWIDQGREVFGCLDSNKELLGLKLLIETLRLHVRLSAKALSLLNLDALGLSYIARKQTFEKKLSKQSEYIVAVDFLISMLTSYQLSMVSHYQAKIENRLLPLNVAQKLVKWCDSQHQKKLPRQWCPAAVLDSHIRNIAQLSSSLKNYLYCCQLLMCIKKNQLKINERDLSLADAQRLDTWCGIKLKELMTPQGVIKRVSDSLIVALELDNLLLNVRCYVKPLDYEQLLLVIREDQAKIDMRALPLDEAEELKKWYWFEYEKRMVSLGSSVPLSNPGIRLIYSFMEKLTFYMNCIKSQTSHSDCGPSRLNVQPKEGSNMSHPTNNDSNVDKMSISDYLLGPQPRRRRSQSPYVGPPSKRQRL